MTANIRWSPSRQVITLHLMGEYTLEESQAVNAAIGEISARNDFIAAALIVYMDHVERPKYSPIEGIRATDNFRKADLRLMVVCGLERRYQVIGKMFQGVIEAAVGMPLRFVDTLEEAQTIAFAYEGEQHAG